MRRFRQFLVAASAMCVITTVAVSQTTPPEHPAAPAANTLRIWVSDKQVKSVHGPISSADLLKEVNAKCTGVVLTDTQENADYRLEAGHAWCCTPNGESRGYDFALFNKDGDAVFSTKTHALGNAVKDVCRSIGRAKEK